MSPVTTAWDVETYVLACLGDVHADYDVPGIVDGLRSSEWWPVPDRPVSILDGMPGFWALVARHDLRAPGDA